MSLFGKLGKHVAQEGTSEAYVVASTRHLDAYMKRAGRSMRGFKMGIRIDGVDETIAALRALEPEVLKLMQKEIRAVGTRVKSEASTRGPSGHPLRYSVRQTTRGKRGAGMRVMAADKQTAIFEFAGTRGLSRSGGPITPQGAAMVRWLDGFGKPGRFLWATWDEHKDVFEADIRAAVAGAEYELQRHLDSIGETW